MIYRNPRVYDRVQLPPSPPPAGSVCAPAATVTDAGNTSPLRTWLKNPLQALQAAYGSAYSPSSVLLRQFLRDKAACE